MQELWLHRALCTYSVAYCALSRRFFYTNKKLGEQSSTWRYPEEGGLYRPVTFRNRLVLFLPNSRDHSDYYETLLLFRYSLNISESRNRNCAWGWTWQNLRSVNYLHLSRNASIVTIVVVTGFRLWYSANANSSSNHAYIVRKWGNEKLGNWLYSTKPYNTILGNVQAVNQFFSVFRQRRQKIRNE